MCIRDSYETIHDITKIDVWFIDKLAILVEMENALKTQPLTKELLFEASDCLLEGFLIVLTDAHDLADSSHLCSELIFNTLEFFKCPACELDNHKVRCV